ncbi:MULTISPECIES: hypothetical protein [Rhizobium]|uniref:Uncharacterized protein n=1 Tax=Rhizobium changzhiense TaxID=2692317 RepID=A0A7Z0RMA2_9HYPH|nr:MULTISPECIES: hypothetical protein [Rhizobium]MCV9947193.1 hypothetical protein [Rhizobium sp. BT-175]MCW0021071.1 hypothetical protein [Rhizobium sp. BT-226]NZD63397.1 hypothetical protein [Rhizobium changzhiense]
MHLAHRIDPSRVSQRSKLRPEVSHQRSNLVAPLKHGLERDIDTTLGKQTVDIRQAQQKRKA